VPMLKVYDCSNSPERPPHRGGGGPVENGMVSLLKKYARQYDATFVNKPTEADVIFTNDVFPQDVLKLDLPRVKRMDGVFWQEEFRERNIPYARAAQQADRVIFISRYSSRSFRYSHGLGLRSTCIIRSCADPDVFYPRTTGSIPSAPVSVVACATSWERPEKRLEAVIRFSEISGLKVLLVGRACYISRMLVTSLGEMPHNKLAAVLRGADLFVNFSYRDPGPKVVAEACASGLPVLFADSGGTGEMATTGIPVLDAAPPNFERSVQPLLDSAIESAWETMKMEWSRLRLLAISKASGREKVRHTLKRYFDVMKEAVL